MTGYYNRLWDEELKKHVFKMQLFEEISVSVPGYFGTNLFILRVPGGWIYSFGEKEKIFIPLAVTENDQLTQTLSRYKEALEKIAGLGTWNSDESISIANTALNEKV